MLDTRTDTQSRPSSHERFTREANSAGRLERQSQVRRTSGKYCCFLFSVGKPLWMGRWANFMATWFTAFIAWLMTITFCNYKRERSSIFIIFQWYMRLRQKIDECVYCERRDSVSNELKWKWNSLLREHSFLEWLLCLTFTARLSVENLIRAPCVCVLIEIYSSSNTAHVLLTLNAEVLKFSMINCLPF